MKILFIILGGVIGLVIWAAIVCLFARAVDQRFWLNSKQKDKD